MSVHPGDVFFIPQGLVHAIGAGILIAEIQENSNVTYRVYDYGRLKDGKPRELHVDSAMKTVRDFTEAEIEALRFSLGKGEDSTIANCPLFKVDRIMLDGERTISVRAPFTSVVVTDGSGTIGGEPFGKGDSFYLPAELGKTVLSGRAELLVTTIPAGGKKN